MKELQELNLGFSRFAYGFKIYPVDGRVIGGNAWRYPYIDAFALDMTDTAVT